MVLTRRVSTGTANGILDSNRDGKFDRRNDTYYAHFGGRKGDIPFAGRWYAEDERDYPWIYQADGTWLIDYRHGRRIQQGYRCDPHRVREFKAKSCDR